MDYLNIFICNKFAGKLLLDKRGLFVFQYDTAYLDSENPIPLSITLPLIREPYTDDVSRPFFSNLLPDGMLRSKIAKEKKFQRRTIMQCLLLLGGNAPVLCLY